MGSNLVHWKQISPKTLDEPSWTVSAPLAAAYK
jgi:hypothetical protein